MFLLAKTGGRYKYYYNVYIKNKLKFEHMKESYFGNFDIPPGETMTSFREKFLKWNKAFSGKAENKVEKFSSGDMFLLVLDQIRQAHLQEEFSSNADFIKNLEKKKEIALNLLKSLIEYVIRYTAQIRRFDKARFEVESERGGDEFKLADFARKSAHDALIAHIQITIRFIRENFIEVDNRGAQEDSEEKWSVLPIENISFPNRNPSRIFLPSYVDLSKRETVTVWAQEIQKDLSKIDFQEKSPNEKH